jgi:hypothetical protein
MKNFFINKLFPVTLPCFLGFNSKCTTSSQIIAKLLNFASTNSGNYGRFFTVSFKYIIFNRRLFDDFYKKLLRIHLKFYLMKLLINCVVLM